MENKMRNEAGLPLRTHYFTQQKANGMVGVGPALINSAGTSIFEGTRWLPTHTLRER